MKTGDLGTMQTQFLLSPQDNDFSEIPKDSMNFDGFYLQIDFVPLVQRADQMVPVELIVADRGYYSEQNLSLPLKEN